MSKLQHFGILGMKWGVRRYQNKDGSLTSAGKKRTNKEKDDAGTRVISRGTNLQNISFDKARTTNHLVYASYTPKDNANYKSFYASMKEKPFENQWVVKKDIIMPSKQKAVSKLKELISEDPDGMYKALGKAKIQSSILRSIGAKMGLKLEDKYIKNFSKMGNERLAEKSFQYFMDTVPAMTDKHKRYMDGLVKEGFSGMVDYHDTKEFNSEDPIIIFKGNSNVKVSAAAKELSMNDILTACDLYYELGKKK